MCYVFTHWTCEYNNNSLYREVGTLVVGTDNVPRSVGPRHICDRSPMYSNWRKLQTELAQFLTILLEQMDQIVLLGYVAPTDDVQYNIFIADNRRLACKVELGSSWRPLLGKDYDSAINVHINPSGIWEPGFSIDNSDRTCSSKLIWQQILHFNILVCFKDFE